MKKTIYLIILLFIIYSNNSLHSQLVREWKTVAEGSFASSYLRSNLAVTNGKYVAAVSSYNQGYDSSIVLILSDNGGKKWFTGLKEKLKNIDSNYMPLPGNWRDRIFQSVEMPSESLIILVGIETLIDGSSNHPFLYRSVDFGKSWERIEISSAPLVFFSNCLSMLDNDFGIMISGQPNGPNKPDLYKTQDGGESWTEFSIGNTLDNEYIQQIKCYSTDEFVVICQNSIFVTSDGGQSWNRNSVPQGSAFNYSFLNNKTWYAAGSGDATGSGDTSYDVLYKTTNAGVSWIKMLDTIIAPSFGLKSVDFYDENNGLAGANAGNIIRTTDGGISWELQTNPNESYEENMVATKFLNKDQAVVLSNSRVYLNTGNFVLKPPTINLDSNGVLDYNAKWNKTNGGTHFKFQLAECLTSSPTYIPSDFDQKIIINLDNLTDTSYILTNKLNFNKLYYLHVKTYSDSMESDWSRMIMFKTSIDTTHYSSLDTCLLAEPGEGALGLPLSVTFKWYKVLQAENYTLIVTKPENISNGKYNFELKNIKDTLFTLDTLQPNTFYIWWVSANANNCLSSSAFYRNFTTGTNTFVQELSNDNIFIYPNPVIDFLYIPNTYYGANIEIYNLLGTKQFETNYNGKINISSLPAGVYYLKVGNQIKMFIRSN